MVSSKRFSQERQEFWEQTARSPKRYDGFSSAYQAQLNHLYRLNVLEGSRVLEIGCGLGNLLASMSPSAGMGADFCPLVVKKAQERPPGLEFRCLDAHEVSTIGQKFDYIILSDLINDVFDVEEVL